MFNTGTKCVFTFYVLHGLSTSIYIYICRGLLQASAVPSPLGPTQHDIIDGSVSWSGNNHVKMLILTARVKVLPSPLTRAPSEHNCPSTDFGVDA